MADSSAAAEAKLLQQGDELRAALAARHDALSTDLKQQLKQQVDAMAEILDDMGTLKADQAEEAQVLSDGLQDLRQQQERSQNDLEHLTGNGWSAACCCLSSLNVDS